MVPRATRRHWCVLALLACALVPAVVAPAPARAHAYLMRSDPPPNSVFPDTPPVIQLWFSEEPEPRFTEVSIYNTLRVRVQSAPIQIAPEDRRLVIARLDPLPPGVYTVVWRALSAVDGHTTVGAFAFGVGIGQEVTGPVPGLVTPGLQASRPAPGEVAVRWLTYVGMAALLGAVAFVPLVFEPAVRLARLGARHGDGWIEQVRAATLRGSLRLAWGGFWLSVAMAPVAAVVQAARAAGLPFAAMASSEGAAAIRTLLLDTRYGQVWFGRVLFLVLVALVLSRLAPQRSPVAGRARSLWLAATAIAALYPLALSLTSHSAAASPVVAAGAPVLPVFIAWVHLVATGVWVGGLLVLALALPAGLAAAGAGRRLAVLAPLVPRFSLLAVASVAALTSSGVYQAVVHAGSFPALFGTDYGRSLIVKLVISAPLFALGGFNLVFSRPRLARAAEAEAAAGDVVVAGAHEPAGDGATSAAGPVAGGGTPTNGEPAAGVRGPAAVAAPPAMPASAAAARVTRIFHLAVGAEVVLAGAVLLVAGALSLTQPARDAWAEITRGLTLHQRAGDLNLWLRLNPAEPGFNAFTLRVEDRNGRLVDDAQRVALVLSHLEHDMGENEVVLAPEGGGRYHAESGLVSMIGDWRVEAIVRRTGRDDVRATFEFTLTDPALPPAAEAATAAGTPVAPATARQLRNPVSPTDESLARGGEIYTQYCLVCHGVQGRGDGPAARTLRPPPADLREHVAQHTDGELWWWISNGIPGTQMPAWRTTLSEIDRWHVLNYIKHAFAPGS